MSVKHAILALLYEKPRHGYEIKTEFDELVQKKWPLNPGQVYTTLDRLMRDELVTSPGQDEKDRKLYSITEKGKDLFLTWLTKPVKRSVLQDEFYFKWLCATKVNTNEEDMVARQKEFIMKEILQLTKFKQQMAASEQTGMKHLADGALLHLEADLKWLELIRKEKNR